MRYEQAGVQFEAVVDNAPTGLVGTIGVRVRDNQGADTIARTTAGISEDIAGSGIYRKNLTIPTAGVYSIVWDTGGGTPQFTHDDVTVTVAAPQPATPPTGAYAAQDDVLARAGRVGGAFSVAGKRPNLSDIDRFLADVAAEIDVEVRRRGYDPALLDDTVKNALRDVNAYGALARALAAIDPSSRPDNVTALIDQAEKVWSSDSSKRGGQLYGILMLLEAGVGGGGPGTNAGSFWQDEPDYPTESDWLAARLNPLEAPEFAKGQKL